MKAWVLHGVNDIRLEDVNEPQLSDGEVLVRVRAAGICGSDIPRIYKDGAHKMPLIPGHEFAGEVVRTGKRAGIFPLIPCMKCGPCRKKHYEMCRNYGYLGSRRDGGFAEYAAVPEWNIIELPDNVPFEEAAMLEPMAVAVHALRRLSPRKNDAAVVFGLGTIGLLLFAFLKDAGVENVTAVGNKEFQKNAALKLGLDVGGYIDGTKEDAVKMIMERTDGRGADMVFECVGKNETFSYAVESAAPSGRVCLVGNPHSDMMLEKNVYWKMLRNQLEVSGTWNSSFTHDACDDWHYALERLSQKKIPLGELITHRLKLGELEKGLHVMRDKTENYIKVMVSFF